MNKTISNILTGVFGAITLIGVYMALSCIGKNTAISYAGAFIMVIGIIGFFFFLYHREFAKPSRGLGWEHFLILARQSEYGSKKHKSEIHAKLAHLLEEKIRELAASDTVDTASILEWVINFTIYRRVFYFESTECFLPEAYRGYKYEEDTSKQDEFLTNIFIEQLTLLFAKTKVSVSYFSYVSVMEAFEKQFTEQLQKEYLEVDTFLDFVEEIALKDKETSIKNDFQFFKNEVHVSGVFTNCRTLVEAAHYYCLPLLALEIHEWMCEYAQKKLVTIGDKLDPILVQDYLDDLFAQVRIEENLGVPGKASDVVE